MIVAPPWPSIPPSGPGPLGGGGSSNALKGAMAFWADLTAFTGLSGTDFWLFSNIATGPTPKFYVHFQNLGPGNFFVNLFLFQQSGPQVSLSISSPALAVPSGPFGFGANWDCAGVAGAIYMGGGANVGASVSAGGGGVPTDPTKILQVNGSYYFSPSSGQGGGNSNPAFKLSQFWLNVGANFDFAGHWSTFFGASDAPADLGSQGKTPTGSQPWFYFPHDASSLWLNEGSLGGTFGNSGTITNATGIPVNGAYQAKGIAFAANAILSHSSPL